MNKTDVFECKCIKCKHEWIKRTEKQPKQCPKCKQYDWSEDEDGMSAEEWFNTDGAGYSSSYTEGGKA